MSDWENLTRHIERRQWGSIAIIAAANILASSVILGLALLALLAGLHGLDWLGALPCFCG